MTIDTRPVRARTTIVRKPRGGEAPAEGDGLRVLPGTGGLIATGVGKPYKKRPVVRNVSISVRRVE